ncbi:MAG TPA: SDR family NAD(P)-dependent oxidoreductase, partial [Salinimicrobium sp.]|nr:SDR family NAD(P)-dependent oxidoreductase [Salinimicrobium sp.]
MDSRQFELLGSSKILVTGGAGFIGSNLCEALIANGSKVICLDNFATGKKENLSAISEHPNFTFIEGDIRNLEDCRKAVSGVDFVLHQA